MVGKVEQWQQMKTAATALRVGACDASRANEPFGPINLGRHRIVQQRVPQPRLPRKPLANSVGERRAVEARKPA